MLEPLDMPAYPVQSCVAGLNMPLYAAHTELGLKHCTMHCEQYDIVFYERSTKNYASTV